MSIHWLSTTGLWTVNNGWHKCQWHAWRSLVCGSPVNLHCFPKGYITLVVEIEDCLMAKKNCAIMKR